MWGPGSSRINFHPYSLTIYIYIIVTINPLLRGLAVCNAAVQGGRLHPQALKLLQTQSVPSYCWPCDTSQTRQAEEQRFQQHHLPGKLKARLKARLKASKRTSLKQFESRFKAGRHLQLRLVTDLRLSHSIPEAHGAGIHCSCILLLQPPQVLLIFQLYKECIIIIFYIYICKNQYK